MYPLVAAPADAPQPNSPLTGHNPEEPEMASTHHNDQLVVEDSVFDRNRSLRWTILGITALACVLIPAFIGGKLFGDWFGVPALGGFIGIAAGGLLFFKSILPKSVIVVEPNHVFVTTDTLRTLLGMSDVYVYYGNGTHISLWWEY